MRSAASPTLGPSFGLYLVRYKLNQGGRLPPTLTHVKEVYNMFLFFWIFSLFLPSLQRIYVCIAIYGQFSEVRAFQISFRIGTKI